MSNYKNFAINIARQAGNIMKDDFSLEVKTEWKKDNSPVTKTDLKINQLVIDSVKENFPTHSVLAEEGSNMIKGSKLVWVCDPLDGTVAFSHGYPIFTFSLALVEDGKPIIGVIYDPILDRMFFAQKNKGTYLNDKKISVADFKELKNTVINVDGSGKELKVDDLKIIKQLKNEGSKIVRFCSVIYGGMLVAAGEFSATLFLKTTVHDMAALKIVIEEAGGKVTDINGNEQRYDQKCNGMIASNGILHDKLVKIVNKKI